MKRIKFITLFSVAGIYFFSMFQRVAVPGTIFNELQAAFSASAAQVAALGAIYLYIYGGMQLFAGMLADGIGSSKTIVFGGVLLALASLLFPLSRTAGQLYASRAVIGLGASLIYISMLKHIDITFAPRNFPVVFSASIFAGYSGGLAATYPFERLAAFAGWRESLAAAGVVCLLFTLAAGFRLRGTFVFKNPASGLGPVKNILKNPKVFPIIASGSANFSVYFLLQAAIGKKMLEDFAGLSSAHAASFTFLMMLTTMLSVLFHGFAGKKTGRRKPFSLSAAGLTASGSALILLNLLLFGNTHLFLACYLMCAWAGGNILNATLMKEISLPAFAATAVGIYNGSMYTAVALTSNAAGLVMDAFRDMAEVSAEAIVYPAASYITIFAGCSALGLVSVVSAAKIKEPGCRAVAEPGR